MLPTWEAASKMRMDCEDRLCLDVAKAWTSQCSHGLIVCHQRIEGSHFQVIVRHGESEGVVVMATGSNGLEVADAEVRQWIDRVHEYEASRA